MKETIEKVDKREHILDFAEKLFSEHGFEGTSTRLISKDACVNMAMLNYYFGSKEGLYKAVLERRISGFRQSLISLNEENISSWEKIYRCIEMYVDRVMGNKCFNRLIHREMSLQQPSDITESIADTMMRNVNEVIKIITEGMKNGSFRKVDTELTVSSILGTMVMVINSSQISSRMFKKDTTDPAILDEIKPRIKEYLKDLLKVHLTNHDQKSK